MTEMKEKQSRRLLTWLLCTCLLLSLLLGLTACASSGSYTMDGDELVLDNGMRLAPDGAGGLIDSDGDALFRSELPD